MKPLLTLLMTPLSLVLAGGLAALVNQSRPGSGPVYSVAALRANLTHDSSAWVGRSVLVRGFLFGCPHPACPGHEPYVSPGLIDPNQPATALDPLPVALEGPGPMLAFLRRVPVLNALVPAPQELHWDIVTTYRVRLRALPAGSCTSTPCYEALLLNAAPGALEE